MIEDLVYAIKSRSGFGPKSNKWKYWKAALDLKTCYECRTIHGKIYSISETVSPIKRLLKLFKENIEWINITKLYWI